MLVVKISSKMNQMVEADLLTYLDGYNIESHCVQQEAEFAEVERKTKIR